MQLVDSSTNAGRFFSCRSTVHIPETGNTNAGSNVSCATDSSRALVRSSPRLNQFAHLRDVCPFLISSYVGKLGRL